MPSDPLLVPVQKMAQLGVVIVAMLLALVSLSQARSSVGSTFQMETIFLKRLFEISRFTEKAAVVVDDDGGASLSRDKRQASVNEENLE